MVVNGEVMRNKIIVQVLKGLLISFCIFWIVSGIIFIVKMQVYTLQYWIVMGLMLLNGICFAIFAYLISKKALVIYIMLMLFVLINTILTVTDQIGIVDWVTLLFNIIILVLSILRTTFLFRKQ
jgi:hypothetical protein